MTTETRADLREMHALDPFAGYQAWLDAAKQFSTLGGDARRRLRVAYLATYTADLLLELLPVAAARHGLAIDVVKTPFGQLEQCVLGAAPLRDVDCIVFAGCWQDLGLAHGTVTDATIAEAVSRSCTLWDAAIRLGARVVQVGFVPPASDPYSLAARHTGNSVTAAVDRINCKLAERASGAVVFVDAAVVAAQFGIRRWESPRHWFTGRMPCAFDALPVLAATVAGAMAVECALTCRCVVVDLDNTLWGGILGDEGPHGIVVGDGAVGEAFAQFQQFLRGLRARGIALAVASKNDAAAVDDVFRLNSSMVLKAADFACIVADWRPKSEQLREISQRLRLGLSSMVFVDDNPAEREQVARALPDVEVVALPDKPAAYVAALAATPGLFACTLADEDLTRGESYDGLRRAEELAQQAQSIEEFLDGLQMRARLQQVDMATLARAAQLVAKTNQFNLTARRRSQGELAALLEDPSYYGVTLRLRDRFADHGIVGFVMARAQDAEAHIDTLLLSCRVIGRTAERLLVSAVAKWAAERACTRMVGVFSPAERNGLVADLYPALGFSAVEAGQKADDERIFHFDLNGAPFEASRHIEEERA